MYLEISIIVFFVLTFSYYYYLTWNFDFWKKRGVNGPRPIPFFGNFKDNILGKIHSTELTKKYYDEFSNEPMVGIFMHRLPVLILRDPALIKDVLVKDFSAFSDRGIRVHDKVEPLSQHFFNLPQETWRPLRMRLSPAFTTLKIKDMFGTISDIADRFVGFVEVEVAKSPQSLECCGLMGKFTTQVIGECGFGLEMHEFTGDVSEFRTVSKSRLQSSVYNFIRRFLRQYCPSIYKRCYLILKYNMKMNNYFVNCIRKVTKYRKSKDIKKNDYIGLLIDIKDNPQKIGNMELSDNLLAAQAYVFFTAGSDTTAMIISNALYEIASNSFIQEKLRKDVYLKNDKTLTFNSLKNMKYLDKVFKETLRKYPLRNIIRKSNKAYTFSGSTVSIPENTRIIIPHYAIHRDNDIYPEPNVFDPERFDDSVKNISHSMSYLPFGDGPRNCIGSKFAEWLSKIAIVSILKKFQLEICNSPCKRNVNDPRKVFLSPKGGLFLKLKKL